MELRQSCNRAFFPCKDVVALAQTSGNLLSNSEPKQVTLFYGHGGPLLSWHGLVPFVQQDFALWLKSGRRNASASARVWCFGSVSRAFVLRLDPALPLHWPHKGSGGGLGVAALHPAPTLALQKVPRANSGYSGSTTEVTGW